jgi:hypothetical protein
MLLIGNTMNSANAPARFTPTPLVWAAGQAIAAAAAHDVAFAADNLPRLEVVDVRTDGCDFADELVTDHKRHGDRLARPLVPFIDVEIGAANSSHQYADQYVVDAGLGGWDVFEP